MFYDFITEYGEIFLNKNIGIFEKLTSENLTKRYLTTSLVLNNWTLVLANGTDEIRSNKTRRLVKAETPCAFWKPLPHNVLGLVGGCDSYNMEHYP